jgi:hypothetical protein
MTPIHVIFRIDPRCQPDHIGLIPSFLDIDDPRPAREQFDEKYIGGWRPQPGFKLKDRYSLCYPGDPPLKPLAALPFRDELILIYLYGYVAIFQPDQSFEASRMD